MHALMWGLFLENACSIAQLQVTDWCHVEMGAWCYQISWYFFFSPEELAVLDVYIGNLLILKSQHFFKNTTPFRPDKICAWLDQTLEPPVCCFIASWIAHNVLTSTPSLFSPVSPSTRGHLVVYSEGNSLSTQEGKASWPDGLGCQRQQHVYIY